MSALPSNYDLYHRRGVQKALNEKAKIQPPLFIDGGFGAKSVAALQAYQKLQGLEPDGVYGSVCQGLLEPFITSKYVLMKDYVSAAQLLGVELAAVQANAETEAQGSGFMPNGLCTIRFERHIMFQQLSKFKGLATAQGLAKRYPQVVNPVAGGYSADPYEQYNLAVTIDQSCAMMSTSWGIFQIMGFNFMAAGYANVQSYVADAKVNEANQLKQYVTFVKTYLQGALWTALKSKDWSTFARLYNGSGNVPVYSKIMADNYTKFVANPNQ